MADSARRTALYLLPITVAVPVVVGDGILRRIARFRGCVRRVRGQSYGPAFAITLRAMASSSLSIPARSPRSRRTAIKTPAMSPAALRCRRRFLRFFPKGFGDASYIDWERGYKIEAHERWTALLGESVFARLLKNGEHQEIARRAVAVESRTNLLFSFEKMALRDAVREPSGARSFARGLFAYLHEHRPGERAFEQWCNVLSHLPRRQTRVLTWPLATVFGFLAQPERHIFLKPNVTRAAAREYGYAFAYVSRPGWSTYVSLLGFADRIRADQKDLQPRDMIDLQSFIWVQGSDEYEE